MDSNDVLKTIEKADKDAKRIVNGETDAKDLELMFRIKIANRLSIGLYDTYFENLTLYQLAFEASLYMAQDEMANQTEQERQEKAADILAKQINNKEVIIPPGFEGLGDSSDEEIFSIKQGDIHG